MRSGGGDSSGSRDFQPVPAGLPGSGAGPDRRLVAPSGAAGLIGVLLILAASGCAHNQEKMVRDLDLQLSGRLGKAKREEVTALLGEPEVKDVIGQLEIWVYQFRGTGAGGRVSPALKEIANYYDELILTFDGNGILQKYTLALLGAGSKKNRR